MLAITASRCKQCVASAAPKNPKPFTSGGVRLTRVT